jgi:hypothetical protein
VPVVSFRFSGLRDLRERVPCDSHGLARIALGTVLVVRTTPLVNVLPFPLARVRGPLFGWPEPGWPMAWGDIVLPAPVLASACVVRTVAAVLFLLGVRARAAGTVAGALGLLAMSQDPFGFVFTLYTLFVGVIVLAWTDAASVLAWRPGPPIDPRSSATLVCVVTASIYVFSGIAKMHVAWLDGRALLSYAEDGLFMARAAAMLQAHDALRISAAWAAMATELGIGVSLLVPRTRRVAIVVAVSMHVVFEIVARPDVMGLVMASLLLACAAPSWRLHRRFAKAGAAVGTDAGGRHVYGRASARYDTP